MNRGLWPNLWRASAIFLPTPPGTVLILAPCVRPSYWKRRRRRSIENLISNKVKVSNEHSYDSAFEEREPKVKSAAGKLLKVSLYTASFRIWQEFKHEWIRQLYSTCKSLLMSSLEMWVVVQACIALQICTYAPLQFSSTINTTITAPKSLMFQHLWKMAIQEK